MHLDSWDESAAVRHDRTLWADLTSLRFGNLGYRIRQSSGGGEDRPTN